MGRSSKTGAEAILRSLRLKRPQTRSRRLVVAVAIAALVATSLPTSSQAQTESFSFTAAGDLGSKAASTASLDAINTLAAGTEGVKFHLALGDLSYGGVGSEPAWYSYVRSHLPAGFPFELISGNHENGTPTQPGSDGYIGNFAECLPDLIAGLSYAAGYGKEYFFDYPAVQPLARVVMIAAGLAIDGDPYSYARGTAHYDWLAGTIDDARAAGIPWVIVGMHRPCIDMRPNTCNSGGDLFDLLVEMRVDLVLAGHSHSYQRSKQLAHDSASCPSVPFQPAVADLDCVVDDGADGIYPRGAGTVFVIDGTFGESLYTLNTTDPETPYFAHYMGLNVASNGSPGAFGITQYTVSGSQITGKFVRTSGSGTFSDTFSISGGGGGDPDPPTTPTGLTGTPGNMQVALTWNASPDSDLLNYDLSYAPPSAPPTLVTGIPKTQTTYTVTGLTNGTQYDFAVRSRDSSGNVSPWSAPFTLAPGSTDATPPSLVITAPAAGATLKGKVAVAGTASDDSGISTVHVAVDGGPFQLVTGTTSWTYSFKSMAYADGPHTITAQAIDTAGNTATSSVSVIFDNTAPPKPTGLTAAAGNTSVSLTWSASTAPDIKDYYVSYRISPSGAWKTKRVNPAPIDGIVSYTVMSLTNGTLYDFRVRARDLSGHTSGGSAIVSSSPTP